MYCLYNTVAPQVILLNETVMVHSGNPARFTCRADGIPLPTVSWYRHNTLIGDRVSGSQTEKQLTFSSTNLTDRGEYTCRAINVAGMDEKVANLIVYSELHFSYCSYFYDGIVWPCIF